MGRNGGAITRHLPRTPSAVMLVGGGAWVVAHASGALGSFEAITFVALCAVAAIATVTGLRWYRPNVRWPWWAIVGALTLFLVGGAMRQQLHTLGDLSPQRSLLPDVITIPGYLLLAIAFAGLGRERRRGRAGAIDAMLDATVAALAALALAWTFLVSPTIDRGHSTVAVEAMIAAYPALSVFLMALAARIAFSLGSRRVVAYRLLLASMGLLLIGDVVYMLAETDVVHPPPSLIDAPYALAYVFFAACMLHPSMRQITEPMPPTEVAPKSGRLVFVAIALGIPAVISVVRVAPSVGDRIMLTTVIVALTATASLRVLRALRAHAESESALAYQATHDSLTKLPNRLAAEARLQHIANGGVSRGQQVALLFLDLDRFKLLNDTMGHSAGDELLVAVAARLGGCLPAGTLVARVGGDEFLIVLEDVTEVSDALVISERVRVAIEAPFPLRGNDVFTSASIGVAFASDSALAADAEGMVREADTAMYRAKDAGRNGVSVFDASMRDRVEEQLTLERDLHVALERNELAVHFQPIIALPAGPVEGVEALLRWAHPARGLIPPAKFIPIAEESMLIVEIGAWVLEQSCRRLAELRREVTVADDFYVSVNVSARQLRDPGLVATVRRVLHETGLPATSLCLEITESMLMEEPIRSVELLGALRDVGVLLSIDDFGTGYSSLAYAQRFPAQCVKIDRSFVDALGSDDTSQQSLVSAIVAMAGALGMKSVAEGGENPAQEARLIQLGCHAAQGYFYSKPVPADQLPATLRRLTVPASALG